MIKKAVFLLHIQPCLRFQSDHFENDFPKMLKNLQVFVSLPTTLENYFKIIATANNSRNNVSTGVKLIIDFLRTSSNLITGSTKSNENNNNIVCSSYLVDKLSESGTLINYLSTLEADSKKQGIKYILDLMSLLQVIIVSESDQVSKNTAVVLFASLILTISQISPNDVFQSLSTLIDELLKNHKGNEFRSYLSFIAAVMAILYQRNTLYSKSEQFNNLLSKLFPNEEFNENLLSLIRIGFKAGFKMKISPNKIVNLLGKCSPSLYHSATIFLYDILPTCENKIELLSTVLYEIAFLVSGRNSKVMNNFDYFTDESEIGKICKSSAVICSELSELLQLCRRILLHPENDIGKLLQQIFDYILIYYSPFKIKTESQSEAQKGFVVFQDKILVYAIFAILSNGIEDIHVNSLLKNETTNTIYYIADIDQREETYIVWQIPISKDSEAIKLKFSSNLKPISIMPFSPSMYANYQNLIPYFKNALNDDNFCFNSFLILSSLQEYSKNQEFLNYFYEYLNKTQKDHNCLFSMKQILLSDTSSIYQKLIKSHLMQNSQGFEYLEFSLLKFYCFSPFPYNISSSVHISSKLMKCPNGIHIFVSTPLQKGQKAILTAKITARNFQIGAYYTTTQESGADYILLTARNHKFQEIDADSNGLVKVIHNSEFGTTITVNDNRINTVPLSASPTPISFIIICYEETTIDYSFITDGGLNQNSFAPLSGQVAFFRQKQKRRLTQSKQINSSLIISKPLQDFFINPNIFRRNTNQMIESLYYGKIGIIHNNGNDLSSTNNQVLIVYPENIKEKINGKLDIRPGNDLQKSNPIVDEFFSTDRQNPSLHAISTSTQILQYFCPEGETTFNYTVDNKKVYIDRFDGTIHSSKQKSIPTESFPTITPLHYSILPPKIINHFATGYLSIIRTESLTNLFVQFISTSNISIEKIIQMFNLTLCHIVHVVIRLVVHLEPVFNSKYSDNENYSKEQTMKFINFNYDVLKDAPRLPFLHSASHALQKIIQYIESDINRLNDFADEWMKILNEQFSDGFSHSCQPNHPHAVIRTFHENSIPYQINRDDVTRWIIVEVGFLSDLSKNLYSVKANPYSFYNSSRKTFAAIPYIKNDNSTLAGTFFDLILSMKYFSIFAHNNSTKLKNMKKYRKTVHVMFFESLIARSPFFTKYMEDIFHFIEDKLVICASDIHGSYISSLNALAIYLGNNQFISDYLNDQEILYNERILLPLKSFYPEFQTPADKLELSSLNTKSLMLELPIQVIGNSFDCKKEYSKVIMNLRRIFKQTNTIIGFPFHLLIEDWYCITLKFPPFSIKNISDSLLRITFNSYSPRTLTFVAKTITGNLSDFIIRGSYSQTMDNSWDITPDKAFKIEEESFFIKIISGDGNVESSWSSLMFLFECQEEISQSDFCSKYHDLFVNDIRFFATQWKVADDQQILNCIESTILDSSILNTSFISQRPITFATKRLQTIPINIRLIRAKFLVIVNWLIVHSLINLKIISNNLFTPLIWSILKIRDFQKLIRENSATERTLFLNINRKAASDIRLGITTNLNMTIMNQMASVYKDEIEYRVASDHPWHVKFTNEQGIDAGGVARELVAECASDLCSTNCGLVVMTPNGRNDIGDYRDCVIPIADIRNTNIPQQYHFAGALIAIAIRTGLVQQFNFPPLVWNYLINGEITIEQIFAIDVNYKLLITSLQEAMNSEMTDYEFAKRFNMKFTVIDSSGREKTLTQRGKTEVVTLSNCGLYISLANEFRLSELKENLEYMREGMLKNFNFNLPPTLDAETLEFAACGPKDISVEALKRVTYFSGIEDSQIFIFWRVIEAFTPEERALLLKFATARVNLPPQIKGGDIFLKVDSSGIRDSLPTASTCFHQLHYPGYSSYEIAYRMMKIAVECTGTIELA
ncbi:hypothetical protein TRFO_24348 [Tritrichomonas foetus]|uniref:HECT domain-containing protein n=1 Tax=Tritrichomonas foetus TaxID=1144522 RepID=A0A1J4K7J1_9EUKA|nr:hypothetical protein TRFO_24348 [Tritrichomonas foetus]|eukprot:OHT07449.1 hypothetical protein TRFO_24348 [Tritrichomonas foetus]